MTDSVYSDADLAALSAFGVKVSRDWITHCRESAAAKAWLRVFLPDCSALVDSEMADWVMGEGSELLAHWRGNNRVGVMYER